MNFVGLLLDVGYALPIFLKSGHVSAFTYYNKRNSRGLWSCLFSGKTLAYSLFQLAEMLQQRFEVHLVLDAEAIPQVTTDTYATES